MHVSHKLILKAYLACCSVGYEEESWKFFDIAKQNRKKRPLSITTPTQPEKKNSFMSNRHSFLVTSVNIAGEGFRKGDDN